MRRLLFNLISVCFSAGKFGLLKLLHFRHFYFDGIQRFSPNTEVVLSEKGTIRLGKHVRAHRRSKLLAFDRGILEIGSNTALVAPVRVGEGALVGAGSVITKDVPDNEMAVARGRQKNLPRRG